MDRAHQALVDSLVAEGSLKMPAIISAFRALPRAAFVRPEDRAAATIDEPLSIGAGQTTSAPSMIASMLELLAPAPGHAVLEIGTGLGWTTALLAHLISPGGTVVSYELEPELAEQARANLARARIANAEVRTGDGTRANGPFDRILLKCAAPAIPRALIAALRARGRLVAPIGPPGLQMLTLLEKPEKGAPIIAEHGRCRFVPLR